MYRSHGQSDDPTFPTLMSNNIHVLFYRMDRYVPFGPSILTSR